MSNIYYTEINMYITSTDPTLPDTGSMNYYVKSSSDEIHTFIQDDAGNIRRSSLPGGTSSYTLRYDGTNWVSNDTLKISTTEVTINDNGLSTIDFRVESDTLTHLIFLDSSADSIGINNNSPNPNTCFDIAGSKPMKFNTMSTSAISLITASLGMITVDSDLSKGVLRLSNGLVSEWRYIDNPLNHTGKGIRKEISNYTLKDTDYCVIADLTGGGFTIYLPASPLNEQTYLIKPFNISVFALLIDGNGKNIEGNPSINITSSNNDPIELVYLSTDNQWYIIRN